MPSGLRAIWTLAGSFAIRVGVRYDSKSSVPVPPGNFVFAFRFCFCFSFEKNSLVLISNYFAEGLVNGIRFLMCKLLYCYITRILLRKDLN